MQTAPTHPTRHQTGHSNRSGRVAPLRTVWIRACVVGELVGFIPPAVAGAVFATLGVIEPVLIAGLVIAGVGEGLVLGAVQQRALDRLTAHGLPRIEGWTMATAIGAGLAWAAGMGGSSLVGTVGLPGLAIAIPAWLGGVVALPWMQDRCLAAAGIRGPRRWIPWSIVAWTVGVSIPVIALSIVPNGVPALAHVGVGIAAAVAMGATVGVITARPLRALAEAAEDCQQSC